MAQAKLGGLYIDLEARTARIEKDLANANTKLDTQTKRMKQTAERNMRAMSNVIKGLVAGAFAAMVKQSIDAADNIGKLSLRLGIGVEALSQYRLVADKTGVAFGTLTTGLQRMTRRISEAATAGRGEAIPALKALGLSAEKLAMLSPEKQFEVLADAFGEVGNQGQKVALAMKIFDTEGVALLQTMEGGSAAIRAMRDEADALGATLSEDTVRQAEAFNDRLAESRTALLGLVQEFIPVANRLLEGFAAIAKAAGVVVNSIRLLGVEFRILSGDEKDQIELMRKRKLALESQRDGLLAARDAMKLSAAEAKVYNSQVDKLNKEIEELRVKLREKTRAQKADTEATEDGVTVLENYQGATLTAAERTKAFTDRLGNSSRAMKIFEQASKDLEKHLKSLEVQLEEIDVEELTERLEQMGAKGQEVFDEMREALKRFQDQTAEAIQGIGAIAGIEIPGGLASEISQRLPNEAGQFLQDAFAGAQYGGFGSQFVGTGSEDGATIGGALGFMVGGPIGAAIGSILGAVIDGEDNPNSQIVTGAFPGRAASDDRIQSPFGDVFVRSGADGFHQIQGQVTQAVSTLLTGLAASLTPEQIASVVLPSTFNIDQSSVQSGEFLEPFFNAVLAVMEPGIQRFVNQFEGLQQRLDALDAVNFTFAQLDVNPIETFATAMERAAETTEQTLERMGSDLRGLGDAAFNSVADMQALGFSLQQYNQFVVQTLLDIENARRSVSGTIGSASDSLTFQTLGREGQFDFLASRAEQLAAGVGGLGSAEAISRTVSQISSLTTQAFGLASPEEQAALLDRFLPFLAGVEQSAQARLDELQASTEAEADATRQALQDAVRTGAAEGISEATGPFGDAAIVIGRAGSQMIDAANILVSTPLQVSISYGEIGNVA